MAAVRFALQLLHAWSRECVFFLHQETARDSKRHWNSLEHPPGSPEVSWPGVAKALKSAGTPRADASTRSISFRFQSCLFLHNVGPTLGPTFTLCTVSMCHIG